VSDLFLCVGVCGWLDLYAKLRTVAWLLEYGIVTIRLAGVVAIPCPELGLWTPR
jgi:hypothetical protein